MHSFFLAEHFFFYDDVEGVLTKRKNNQSISQTIFFKLHYVLIASLKVLPEILETCINIVEGVKPTEKFENLNICLSEYAGKM